MSEKKWKSNFDVRIQFNDDEGIWFLEDSEGLVTFGSNFDEVIDNYRIVCQEFIINVHGLKAWEGPL